MKFSCNRPYFFSQKSFNIHMNILIFNPEISRSFLDFLMNHCKAVSNLIHFRFRENATFC